jgi:thioredoxin reductase
MYDCLIVGGGPAGLSAALILGRCRRRILVCDAGRPRNFAATHIHGYLTRDNIEPSEFQRLAREELFAYGIEWRQAEVTGGRCLDRGFEVQLEDGQTLRARKILLATGVRDIIPDIPGFDELYGRSIHHCPYCDGWEHRDQCLIAYGHGSPAIGLALSLKTWSSRIVACTNGNDLSAADRQRASAADIPIRTEPIARFLSEAGQLRRIEFQSGPPLECDALFFNTEQVQRSNLAEHLGCAVDDAGTARTNPRQRTSIPGLFLAGDADRDVQFVIVAAAEGATAAVAINHDLQEEDRGETTEPRTTRSPAATAVIQRDPTQ